MSTTNLSAAQLAQQNNRGPGGRYAEGSHCEAGDLHLPGAAAPSGTPDGFTTPGGAEFAITSMEALRTGTFADGVERARHRVTFTVGEEPSEGFMELARTPSGSSYWTGAVQPSSGSDDIKQLQATLNARLWLEDDDPCDELVDATTPDGVVAAGGGLEKVNNLMDAKMDLYRDDYHAGRMDDTRGDFNDNAVQALRAVENNGGVNASPDPHERVANARAAVELKKLLCPSPEEHELHTALQQANEASLDAGEVHFQGMVMRNGRSNLARAKVLNEAFVQRSFAQLDSPMYDEQALLEANRVDIRLYRETH